MRRSLIIFVAALAIAATLSACGASPRLTPPAAATPPRGDIVLAAATSPAVLPVDTELSNLLWPRGLALNLRESAAPQLDPASVGLSTATGTVPRLRAGQVAVPVGFGGVSVVFSLPGVRHLSLDAPVLASILSGRVGRWNARPIASLNLGERLPSLPITVVHIGPASELTALLSRYESTGSARWRHSLGTGALLSWPAGTAASSEAAAAQLVAATPGAIGYVSALTAGRQGLTSIRLQNHSGNFVAPSIRALSAVGAARTRPGQALVTVDAASARAYPIAEEAFATVYRDACAHGFSARQAEGVREVLDYLTGTGGQALITRFGLAPLPRRLRAQASATAAGLSCSGNAS